jgi:hypothetical protein
MKSLIRVLVVPGLLLIGFVCVFAQNAAGTKVPESNLKGGVITLYALDPLAQSFCFRDAGNGHVFYQHEVRNRCSDINYSSYYAEHFAVGIEGRRLGSIVDLGASDDLKKEYGYEETVGGGQGFASVHLEDGKVVILKDRRAQAMQDLKEAAQLFTQATSVAKAPVKIGHVYLARITDSDDGNFQVVVKLLVIGYVPGESVTFRWQAL